MKKSSHSTHAHYSLKETIKKASVLWLFAFFALLILQQPSNLVKQVSQSEKMVFVLPGSPADWGVDPLELQAHGAADQWDFLFEDEATSTGTYEGSMSTTKDVSVGSSVTETPVIPSSSDKDIFPVDESEVDTLLSSGSVGVFTGTMQVEEPSVTTDSASVPSLVSPVSSGTTQHQPKNCMAPWGEIVEHKDFVLAYQQRTDVNTMCNVQKRYCSNGKLTGSFRQQSCKENETYSYTKVEALSYNDKSKDPYVQPGDPALSGASFDVHGKINTTQEPIDVWPDGKSVGKALVLTTTSQASTAKASCTTPWGEAVQNGQFVKAYSASVGLIDIPCEVELRLCVNGILKGNFQNRSCTAKDMTYRDYLVGNKDSSSPTASDLINSLDTDKQQQKDTNSSFRDWLSIYL